MTPSEEAFAKRWSNDCVHVVRLEDGTFAVLDRLFFVRGFWRPGTQIYLEFIELLNTVLNTPPESPPDRHKREKLLDALQTLKDLGL